MNKNKETKDIIEAIRSIEGLEDTEEDDCLQSYEDIEWIMIKLRGDGWED